MSLTIFFSSKIIVNLLKGFKIEEALPFALGLNLFIVNDFPTYASLTIRLSISNCLLFSALAIAAFNTFNTLLEILLLENLS